MKALFGKINTYLFFALALFPILDFAILNIITGLFIITIPFDLKKLQIIPKRKVYFVIALLLLSFVPVISDFQCSLGYWLSKVFPLYIISLLMLFAPAFITSQMYEKFKSVYIIGVVIYIFRFIFIVFNEVYQGKLSVIFSKKFLFYSDIMNLLRSEINVLDSYYHKPYLSLIVLMALLFVTKRFIEGRNKVIYFVLILFFLVALVFPLSLPNIALVFVYLFYVIYVLFKQKQILLSTGLLVGVSGFVLFFFYKSFKHSNLDITEDVGFIMQIIQGEDDNEESIESNPRKIIYTALLQNLDDVPFLGYGLCKGKDKVTTIVEKSITNNGTSLKHNFLVDTEVLDSYLWQRNGVEIEPLKDAFKVLTMANNCKAHTFYQIVDDLTIDSTYTFSVSVKVINSNVVLRLGDLNNQMVIFDNETKQFSYVGKDIINPTIIPETNGYFRIGLTTKVKKSRNLALIGFSGKENQYNHCEDEGVFEIKFPQLEEGVEQTAYGKGLTKNENNILGSKINAHNVFLQEYYLGGIFGLIAIICLYGWFIYLGNTSGDKLLTMYVIAVLFNSFFEYIQYRQIGISIIIIISILLIFKKKE